MKKRNYRMTIVRPGKVVDAKDQATGLMRQATMYRVRTAYGGLVVILPSTGEHTDVEIEAAVRKAIDERP